MQRETAQSPIYPASRKAAQEYSPRRKSWVVEIKRKQCRRDEKKLTRPYPHHCHLERSRTANEVSCPAQSKDPYFNGVTFRESE